jgi:hypothetical protein
MTHISRESLRLSSPEIADLSESMVIERAPSRSPDVDERI